MNDTPEEAESFIKEYIGKLTAGIEAEYARFRREREEILALSPESFADQEDQSHRLRNLTWAFEERVYPMRRELEAMKNTVVRLMNSDPPTWYYERLPVEDHDQR